jgi:hypothetical protein
LAAAGGSLLMSGVAAAKAVKERRRALAQRVIVLMAIDFILKKQDGCAGRKIHQKTFAGLIVSRVHPQVVSAIRGAGFSLLQWQQREDLRTSRVVGHSNIEAG